MCQIKHSVLIGLNKAVSAKWTKQSSQDQEILLNPFLKTVFIVSGNSFIEQLYYLNMSMIGKKSIPEIQIRKPMALSRLIKCYVCNQHFETQKNFELHLQQHQNKLAKTNIEEIQRKTQESFRSKKQPSSLNKTQLFGQSKETLSTMESNKKPPFSEKELEGDEKEERQIEEALRQSQILLQKIEFMTQVAQSQEQKVLQPKQDDDSQQIKKWISNEHQLFNLITKADGNASIEKLILATNFQEKYFENYQQQLRHLRLLATVAVSPASIAKITDIRKNISRDVCAQLQRHFTVNEPKIVRNRKRMIEEPKLGENQGEVRFCADCFGSIGGSDRFYSLSCGHNYHLQCWSGECC